MNELFDIPESKSPKMIWMERHWLKIEEQNGKFRAIQPLIKFDFKETEDEALTHAAKTLGIRLWNEEQI